MTTERYQAMQKRLGKGKKDFKNRKERFVLRYVERTMGAVALNQWRTTFPQRLIELKKKRVQKPFAYCRYFREQNILPLAVAGTELYVVTYHQLKIRTKDKQIMIFCPDLMGGWKDG